MLNNATVWSGNTGPESYRQWHSLAPITSNFQAGWNTLEFVIRNNRQGASNPTGFRLEADVFTTPGSTGTSGNPVTPPNGGVGGGGEEKGGGGGGKGGGSAVPEPSALFLAGSGLAMLGGALWKRRPGQGAGRVV